MTVNPSQRAHAALKVKVKGPIPIILKTKAMHHVSVHMIKNSHWYIGTERHAKVKICGTSLKLYSDVSTRAKKKSQMGQLKQHSNNGTKTT